MAKLPISRVVDVTVTRADRFPTREGFGIPLIATSQAGAVVDAATRTKLYGAMDEVAADWDAADEAYKAALAVFSQNPRPKQLKIGFVDADVLGATPTESFGDELDAIEAYDSNWYWLVFAANFRDDDNIDDAIAWIEARNKQLFLGSNDVLTENAASALSVAARNKSTFDRTSVFYHTDAGLYFDAAAAGYTARRNFDEAGSAYTLKFKRLRGITPLNKDSAVVQAITGFVPQQGLDTSEGHLANAYVEIGGLPMAVEGNVLSGAFIDEIHASDWLIARTQEEILGILANSDRVAMTNTGVHQLVSGVETVLQRAFVAGLIADVEDEVTGELLPAYTIEVERVEDIPAAQRRNRIAPDIRATFRYAGAVHYSTVRMNMVF